MTAWNDRLPMRVLYIGNEMPVLPDNSGAVLSAMGALMSQAPPTLMDDFGSADTSWVFDATGLI